MNYGFWIGVGLRRSVGALICNAKALPYKTNPHCSFRACSEMAKQTLPLQIGWASRRASGCSYKRISKVNFATTNRMGKASFATTNRILGKASFATTIFLFFLVFLRFDDCVLF
jgi:hypothetical protein